MKHQKNPIKIFSSMRLMYLAGLLCALTFALTFASPQPAKAQTETQSSGHEINNAGLGFSYHLPAGWEELSPMLMAMYNGATGSMSQSQGAPYLVAAYSNKGSQLIPPVLMMHYIEQPISADMVTPYNNLFMEETKDVGGKTALAQKLGLANDIRFIEAKTLRPGTPMAVVEADSTFGFTVTVMASPYYFKHGMLVLSYFAPKNDFPLFEEEMLTFFKNIAIDQEQLPD